MRVRYIVLGFLMSAALSMSARTFLANEEIRVNADQSHESLNWSADGASLFLYLFQSNGQENLWLSLTKAEGDSYRAVFPSQKQFDRLIVVRKTGGSSADWSGTIWNQTCNVVIPDNQSCNVLYKFWMKKGDCKEDAYSEWHTYTAPVSQIKSTVSGVTQEEISVCASALGTLFSLHPKIKADGTDYAYENIAQHTWLYSQDKSSWTSLDNYAGKEREEENDKDINTTIPATLPAGGVYYYLYSILPAGRRLIHVTTTTEDCELDCDITSFETAISAVNADNNTYTLDGMVAFGEANGKALVISCDGKDTTIAVPHSPQSFSLYGVPAATENGKKTTAKAYFLGGSEACSSEITIDVPNAREATTVTQVDSLTGRSIVLTPKDYDPANAYIWLANGDTIKGAPQVLVIDPFDYDSTVTYTYKEYYPTTGSMDDLMKNGSYENAAWDYGTKGSTGTVSEYNYWGIYEQTDNTSLDFYNNTTVNPSLALKDNGFAVVRNANNFAPTFAKVTARDGKNFALFDAKSGDEGANKKAWSASTAQHPDLKLKQGTTYVLSFWAANINNYGEMDNAAEFEFRIETKGGSLIGKSRKPLNLSDAAYRNNIWHQLSETFYADKDYDDIVISVVNLNKKKLKVGNDFALDDIQFHPISSVSKVVKSQQQFIVTAHEPKVDAFTATTQTMLCHDEQFTVKMQVKYRNAQDSLFVRDLARDTIYGYIVPDKAIEVQGTFDFSISLPDSLAETKRNWEAYFKLKPANKQTAQSDIPVRLSCDKKDTTICEGDTMIWMGKTYPQTPFIGTDTFTSGYDSLILTIQPLPRITAGTIALTCEDANEVRVPFTVSNGKPDTYTLTVSGTDFNGKVEGKEIVFALRGVKAGDYNATVTVGQTGSLCETTCPVSFSLALAGQLYSKWTDVLFVSNKDSLFVAYQWYADGVAMTGETRQYLYVPSGLSGTSTIYHCCMTTKGDETVSTCPQAFDDVTPSRTQNTGSSAARTIYDTMGRRVSGTPKSGIYILIDETEGQRTSTKILIYD